MSGAGEAVRRRPPTGGVRLWLWLAVALAASLACGPASQTRDAGREQAAAPLGPPNAPPELRGVRLEPYRPLPGERVRVVLQASDPDGDPVRIGYRWEVGGRRLADDGPELQVPALPRGTHIEVVVTAADERAESEPVRATVQVGNRAPQLRAVSLEPATEVTPGSSVLVVPDAEDPDGDPLRYRYVWTVNGRRVDAGRATFSTAGLQRGDEVRVRVVADDGEDESPGLESAPVRVANRPPRIASQPGGVASDGVFRYRIEASDPDGDRRLRYRLVAGPQGMELDSVLGEVSWRPTASQAGRHEVTVAVQDPHGGEAQQRFELNVQELVQEAGGTPPAQVAPR